MPRINFPTAQTVLIILTFLVAILTWLIPSGEFERLSYDAKSKSFTQSGPGGIEQYPGTQETLDSLGIKIALEKFSQGAINKPVSIPGTYRKVTAQPQGIREAFQAPIRGTMEAVDVILFILILGGCIGVVYKSGAFDKGIASLSKALHGREALLIIAITSLIALGGTTFGLGEETIAFYPILVPVFLAVGYDAMVAVACLYIGSNVGILASTVNPFATIIASNAAGVNWTDGLEGRIVLLILGLIVSIAYIIRYANRVKKDPSKSLIYKQKQEIEALFSYSDPQVKEGSNISTNLILLVFTSCFVVMIYGVSSLDWWFTEMATVFLVGAILIGFIARLGEKTFVESFITGAGDLLGVALIIGLARGINILMTEGLISDTILYYLSSWVKEIPAAIFVNIMLFINAGLDFFIPSTSGKAVLTMPIFAPLADVIGIGREQIVNAYQCGQGLFAMINPTNLILASLAMVKVGYDKWLRFMLPLLGLLLILCMAFLTINTLI